MLPCHTHIVRGGLCILRVPAGGRQQAAARTTLEPREPVHEQASAGNQNSAKGNENSAKGNGNRCPAQTRSSLQLLQRAEYAIRQMII